MPRLPVTAHATTSTDIKTAHVRIGDTSVAVFEPPARPGIAVIDIDPGGQEFQLRVDGEAWTGGPVEPPNAVLEPEDPQLVQSRSTALGIVMADLVRDGTQPRGLLRYEYNRRTGHLEVFTVLDIEHRWVLELQPAPVAPVDDEPPF